jgi:hypothetical protein
MWINKEGFDRGQNMFGIRKVIFSISGFNNVIFDEKGEYGMTQNCMAFVVNSKREGLLLSSYLLSERFQEIVKATMWGGSYIDYRMFRFFKRQFWLLPNNEKSDVCDLATTC